MNSKEIKAIQNDIKELQRSMTAMEKSGSDQQKRYSGQISDIKRSLVDTHEREKQELRGTIEELRQIIVLRDAEIAELKGNQS